MSFTPSTTVTNVHQSLGDFPAEDDHLTSEQLKELFDAPATGLKSSLNGLIGELEATTSAASLGAAAIAESDTSAANVQAKLNKLYQDLQEAALGDIPDNTITQAKLTSDFSNSIAIKDVSLQTGLNADQLDGYHASSFALKNGNLQSNLNAEKLGSRTKDQLIADITDRQSASDGTFTKASSSSATTQSYTMSNIKCRYILMLLTCNGDGVGLYDCRNNKFLFAIRRQNSTEAKAQVSVFTTELSIGSQKIQNVAYSNGTLTFEMKSTDAATIRCMQLDGLLP